MAATGTHENVSILVTNSIILMAIFSGKLCLHFN